MYCADCGQESSAGKYCMNCGANLNFTKQNETEFDFSENTNSNDKIDQALSQASSAFSEPPAALTNKEVADGGFVIAKILGWILLIPTVILSFPTWTFITDGSCQWVTVSPYISISNFYQTDSFFCMYAVDEYSAKAEALYYGLAVDKFWVSYPIYLAMFAALWVTTFLLIRAGRKRK